MSLSFLSQFSSRRLGFFLDLALISPRVVCDSILRAGEGRALARKELWFAALTIFWVGFFGIRGGGVKSSGKNGLSDGIRALRVLDASGVDRFNWSSMGVFSVRFKLQACGDGVGGRLARVVGCFPMCGFLGSGHPDDNVGGSVVVGVGAEHGGGEASVGLPKIIEDGGAWIWAVWASLWSVTAGTVMGLLGMSRALASVALSLLAGEEVPGDTSSGLRRAKKRSFGARARKNLKLEVVQAWVGASGGPESVGKLVLGEPVAEVVVESPVVHLEEVSVSCSSGSSGGSPSV